MDLSEVVNFASSLAKETGKTIKKAFSGKSHVSTKSSPSDLVTETDQLVEKLLINGIKQKYPTHKFIGEESTAGGAECNLTDEPTWIIDPIDGTTNFVHRLPQIVICLGFCLNGKPTAGIIYNPIQDQLFTAIRGQGAYCNDVRLKVSTETDLTQSLIMTELGSSREEEIMNKVFANMKSILSTPVHGYLELCLISVKFKR